MLFFIFLVKCSIGIMLLIWTVSEQLFFALATLAEPYCFFCTLLVTWFGIFSWAL